MQVAQPLIEQLKAVDEIFTYHAPDAQQIADLESVREAAKNLVKVILSFVPSSADRSAAIRHIREATMTANAAIVLRGKGL